MNDEQAPQRLEDGLVKKPQLRNHPAVFCIVTKLNSEILEFILANRSEILQQDLENRLYQRNMPIVQTISIFEEYLDSLKPKIESYFKNEGFERDSTHLTHEVIKQYTSAFYRNVLPNLNRKA